MSSSKLHSSIFHPILRKLQCQDVAIEAHNLMYPLFLVEDDDVIQDIPSMPGVARYGLNTLLAHLEPLVAKGLQSVLLFGVIDKMPKDPTGSGADCATNPVIRALPRLRAAFPDLLIACDVCLCPYTDHGHCGVLTADGIIDNEPSIKRIAEIALAYATAGAHIVAPSDMMDNRIYAIKQTLRSNNFDNRCSVLSYSVKFASGFYGPFRDAAKSAPAFGDRKCYQLPPGSKGIAKRAAKRDVEEGADMLMVKPGMAYLDIVKQVKDDYPELPLFIYQVSGEYSMLLNAAQIGAFDLKTVLWEVLVAHSLPIMDDQVLVEAIFEAITIGDEEAVERCIGQATIETVLEFERSYGESPVHLCVKIGGMSHLGVVRCLLSSGLFDSTVVDGEGNTVLTCAYANGDNAFVEELIKVEIDGLDDATACYKMMRHDSVPIFKMFLSIKQYNETEEFQHIASALIQMNVKNFPLSDELRIFAQWKLSVYGFRNLSGNWPGTKDPNEWKYHIDVIGDCWRVIREKHNTRLHADVDDQFLHRLQVLHNHFYFLKHKQSLGYLPMQEAIFCVAIFLSIFRNSSQFHEYRLMVNKCMIIDFVRMICAQLAIARKYLDNTEADLLQIATQIEASGAANKDQLIARLMEKIASSGIPNKAHVVTQLEERVRTQGSSNKDGLIKDMIDKAKKIDKKWAEQMMVEVKSFDQTHKDQLIQLIGKRLRHVAHPQNVATRLMAEWKKGKPTAAIVAGIVSGETFNLQHLMRSKDRRIKRKLVKCYIKTKQFYSLYKIVFYCEQINTERKAAETPNLIDIACMKRVVQVLGEAVKNTQNSANMPGKAEYAISTMLTALFPDMNMMLREVFSHNMSLKKVLLGEGRMKILCKTFSTHMGMVKTAFQLLFVISGADVRQSFYGVMRQCNSFERLRSLLRYVGNTDELERRQLACHVQVTKYFHDAKATFAELRELPIGKTPQFAYLQQQLEVKCDIIKQVDKYFQENTDFGYTEIRQACFTSDDLPSVHRLLDWKLTMHWANKFFQNVRLSWHSNHVQSMAIEWMDYRALKYNPAVIAGVLKNSSTVMDCAEEFEYIVHTKGLAEDIGVADAIDEEGFQQMNKRLKPYYNNLFFLDNKWRVLEAFCKERKLPWNKELSGQLVKRDQENLQALFDGCRERLSFIMEAHDLRTLEGLTTRMFYLPTPVLASIELIQLELCEMLSAVGHFGDSFHYVKYRIPMIQGKNFRNFLAHDALSYNLLTDSSMEKIVINAFVLSTTEVRLFGNHGNKSVNFSFPSVEVTHHWVDTQQRLLGQFQAQNVRQMHAVVRAGGEIKTNFCNTAKMEYCPVEFCALTQFVNPCAPVHPATEYVERYFAGFKEKRSDEEYQLAMALNLGDYETAFNRTVGRGDRMIREMLFSWEDLMPNVRKTDLFVHLTAAMNRKQILSKLIEHEFPHPAILLLSIMLHWHDIFTSMMAKADIDASTYQFLLVTTAQARNYTAALYLLEHDEFRRYLPVVFEPYCTRAVRMGEHTVLEYLLEVCAFKSPQDLAKILHEAALTRRWNCVKLLLERDVPVDVLFSETLLEESCTFLILVKFGQDRLLGRIKTVNRVLFSTIAKHPLAIAIRNGMTSSRMIRALRRLGFDWLDNSTILNEAILTSDKNIYAIIKQRLGEYDATPDFQLDHFGLALSVLQRWKLISYVEETKSDESALFFAVRSGGIAMVEELLNWGRKTRTIAGIGVLGGIVFEQESTRTCFGKRTSNRMLWNTRDGCEDMIIRLECCALLEEMIWQEFTIDTDYAVGRYLFDECIRRDLRNEKGTSVLELDDGVAGNRLIHSAVSTGRCDIIKRLLEHHVDVSVVNSYGVTPVLFAISASMNRPALMIKMLLEYDASTIDKPDSKGSTLLHYAARENNIELLQVVLEHRPNLMLRSELSALGLALLLRYTNFAKCLLNYAIENGILGITQVDEDDDIVVLSLICNDYELSKALLEYELQHTLEDADERDLPRLKSVVEGKLPRNPNVTIAHVIQLQGFTESEKLLNELLILCTSIAAHLFLELQHLDGLLLLGLTLLARDLCGNAIQIALTLAGQLAATVGVSLDQFDGFQGLNRLPGGTAIGTAEVRRANAVALTSAINAADRADAGRAVVVQATQDRGTTHVEPIRIRWN
uniref:Delta-aminolevulinic acid dehydratase n=1 Tax=Anopheles dirus TaxID=7168 RepID=A0A182NC96_9DIPT